MPIVTIELVRQPQEKFGGELVSGLASGLGKVFGSSAGGTWVKVYQLTSESYAENGGSAADTFPVIVHVLKSSLPTSDHMQKEVEEITSVVARLTNRRQDLVHIIYEPPGKGRVAFGGSIVK